MDIVKTENVDVPNSVIVNGLTQTNLDKELEESLETHGPINRHLLIDNPNSEFHRHLIVEFAESSAMHTLRPLLPLVYKTSHDTEDTLNVQALDSIYTLKASSSATKGYLETLQTIARASGKSFEEMLQEELMKMVTLRGTSPPGQETLMSQLETVSQRQELVAGITTTPSPHTSPLWDSGNLEAHTPTKRTEPTATHHSFARGDGVDSPVMIHPGLPMSAVNPPSVQRVVVEHIVKTDAATSHQKISFRLRVFSGKSPRPNHEPDYDTWRASVEFLMTDPSISDLHRTQKILDSLLPPATDVIKQVNPRALPSVYLELLDSVYGSVEDGDDLAAKFMSTLQDAGEKPSSYLHRLQVILSTAIRRGGIGEEEQSRFLLKQFCRGCWNHELITDLQLERKKMHPPSYSDLVFLIRTEEERHASKEERMMKHLGLNKQVSASSKFRTAAHRQTVNPSDVEAAETDSLKRQVAELQAQVAVRQTPPPPKPKTNHSEAAEIHALKRQLADLQAQMTSLRVQNHQMERNTHSKKTGTQSEHRPTDQRTAEQPRFGEPTSNRPRPWYCFRCGEDGHIAPSCESEPNPLLVEEKRRRCRERQLQWDQLNY